MAGSIETKAISALKLELKLELAGAELGNIEGGRGSLYIEKIFYFFFFPPEEEEKNIFLFLFSGSWRLIKYFSSSYFLLKKKKKIFSA